MHLRRQRSVGLSIEFGQPKASTIVLRPHSQVTLIDVTLASGLIVMAAAFARPGILEGLLG